MARPTVTVVASPTLFVGVRSVIEIDVTTTKATKVDFIDARLVGEQGWTLGSGNNQVSVKARFPQLTDTLMGDGILPAATTTRFTTRFTLPPGTPPTHAIVPAYARLRLRIHISIPWHLDGRYDYEFPVHVQAPRVVERLPYAIRSTDDVSKPRIELSLASTRLVVGETLVGTCALFHLDDRAPREVELALVPELVLLGRGRVRERRGRAFEWALTVPAGRAGTGVPFNLPLSRSLTPTFETVTHSLRWWLVARSGSFFGAKVDVSVPLELVDSSAAATTPKLVAAPRLGDERIATIFATFAAREGWRGGAATGEDERVDGQFSIERELGACRLHLAYSYRGEDGTFLVARIDHLSLGLGLSITPSSVLRHVFFRDVEVDIAAWDRAHHVVARSAAQAIPFLREVVPVEMLAIGLGALVRWTDSEIVFEDAVSTIDATLLGAAAGTLDQLARAIAAARERIAPPEVVTDLAAWHALAAQLVGHLTIGDLSIEGKVDGLRVDLGLGWDAAQRPATLHVSVGEPEAASAELREVAISLPHPAADVLGVAAADRLVDQLTAWPEDITSLQVADGVASALYVLPAGDRPVVDVARVRGLVDSLRAVLRALAPAASPYR